MTVTPMNPSSRLYGKPKTVGFRDVLDLYEVMALAGNEIASAANMVLQSNYAGRPAPDAVIASARLAAKKVLEATEGM